jgi:hypothetical protein
LYSFLQRLAIHEFENQASGTVGFFQSIDMSDIGMIQRSENFGLTLESRDAVGIV